MFAVHWILLVLPDAVASDSAALIDNIAISFRPRLRYGSNFCFIKNILDFSAYSDNAIGLGLWWAYNKRISITRFREVSGVLAALAYILGIFSRLSVYSPRRHRKGVLRTVLKLFIVWHSGLWQAQAGTTVWV